MQEDPDTVRLLAAALRNPAVLSAPGVAIADLERLAAAAEREGVSALLWRAIGRHGVRVPEPARARVREATRQTACVNLARWQSLRAVLRLLETARVPVLALKGVHLAERVYRNLSLRPMGDIDLLVAPEHFGRADAALRHGGLKPGETNDALTERSHFHFRYVDQAGFTVELHWHVHLPERAAHIDLGPIWRRATLIPVAGQDVHVMALEDLLVHLFSHAGLHRLRVGLRGLCDVHEVVVASEGRLDWPAVRQRTQQWGAARLALLTVQMCRELLGTPFPPDALAEFPLTALDPRWLSAGLTEVLSARTRPLGFHSRQFGDLVGARGLGRRSVAVARAVFPARDLLSQTYGLADSWRSYAWYGRRWADLVVQYGPHLWAASSREVRRAARERVAVIDWLEGERAGDAPAVDGGRRAIGDRA